MTIKKAEWTYKEARDGRKAWACKGGEGKFAQVLEHHTDARWTIYQHHGNNSIATGVEPTTTKAKKVVEAILFNS